jgi:hypothetical protein
MGTLACGSLDTYPADLERLRLTLPALADEIAAFVGIGQVIDWMTARTEGRPSIDLIGMDEFEYDFLVECSPEGCWLAFGVT